MKNKDKEALVYRLKWILKYAEEGRMEAIKLETKSIIKEVEKLDLVAPF